MSNKKPDDIARLVDSFVKDLTEAVKSKKKNAKTKPKISEKPADS